MRTILLTLQLHCVDEPSELCSVDISEQKLNNVKPEELQVFGNVAYIDASVNSLSLGSFSSFVSLRELNLSLNGLCDMTCHAADFPHLQVLDLSYNSSSADDIISIGHLPRLKVLHLTGNQLHHLPHLGSFIHDPTQQRAEEDESDFKALEVLILDDNKLTSGVFNSLANLQRLKYLNLQGNLISEIPYLQLAVEEREEDEEGGGGGGGIAHTQTTPSAIEDFKKISQERRKRSSLPLPELQFLDLSDNKLAEEEALMAAALFPKLREMDIHSNPLTTQRSGDPPLLTHYLHLRLGVTIKRKKSREAAKFPPKASAHPKWKVEGRTPKMALTDATCSAQRSESEVDDDDREDPEHFFVTQATDVPGCEFVLPDDEKRAAAAGSRETSPDAQWSPDVPVEPGGIQTAVRMLEHALKNLNVLRDPKPGVDRIQMRRRERRVGDVFAAALQHYYKNYEGEAAGGEEGQRDDQADQGEHDRHRRPLEPRHPRLGRGRAGAPGGSGPAQRLEGQAQDGAQEDDGAGGPPGVRSRASGGGDATRGSSVWLRVHRGDVENRKRFKQLLDPACVCQREFSLFWGKESVCTCCILSAQNK
ncbi:X-ray radiation resistance-associated protein 1 isoform X4 [Pseudoliparis swirei]|uniref:X-ray radiation resistance-associated protein 1 isoform X4 n=1 Tax=Pseudoliparis swirei TaxID=2059687 RepID=UPI0024BDA021|nr:X-ray radiation resistance-associated protein 1 isoform X4 [Pseudoliparis swirei]